MLCSRVAIFSSALRSFSSPTPTLPSISLHPLLSPTHLFHLLLPLSPLLLSLHHLILLRDASRSWPRRLWHLLLRPQLPLPPLRRSLWGELGDRSPQRLLVSTRSVARVWFGTAYRDWRAFGAAGGWVDRVIGVDQLERRDATR